MSTFTAPGAPGIYVASRASIPERPAMWRSLRQKGWNITSTWIDEAGPGQTASYPELWARIQREIAQSVGVLLYAAPGDLPLKGALIECGMALGMGKPVAAVLPGVEMTSIGSWLHHPRVQVHGGMEGARDWLLREAAGQAAGPRAQTEMHEPPHCAGHSWPLPKAEGKQ